jgi:diguanylate cyclase (GGDEF)-like protein/PAS domain S-box-containing protein
MPSKSKQAKGKRRVVGQLDYVALSADLVDAIESGVYIVQSKKFVYVNPFFEKLTGYSREELIGIRSFKLVLPQDRLAVRKKATRNLKSRLGSKPYEYRFIKKNGEIIWVMERVSPIDYMGQKATLGSFVDITNRKKTEEALVRSEERYRTILEEMQDSYYEVNLAGNFTFVSDSFCGNLGYAREELVGTNYRLITTDKEIKPVFRAFNQVYRTGELNKGFVSEVIRKDGSVKYYESSIALQKNELGEIIGFHCVGRDITGRKRMEQDLLFEKQFSDAVIDSLPGLFYILDEKGDIIRWNINFERILGYSVEELPSVNALAVIAEEDRELVAGKILETFSNGNANVEVDMLAKSGQKIPYYLTGVRTIIGDKIYLLGEGIDITERKKAEGALHDIEERYRALFDRSLDLVYVRDLKGNFEDANPAALNLLGYQREDIPTLNFVSLLDPTQFPKTIQILKELTETGFQKEPSEFKLKRKDGAYLYVETQESIIYRYGKPHSVQGIGRDITERKQKDEALKASEAQYRLLADHMRDQVWLMDLNLKPIYISPSVEKLRGYTFEELAQLPPDRQLTATSFQSAMEFFSTEMPKAQADPTYFAHPLELEWYCKDGSTLWVESTFSQIRDENGKPMSLLGVGRDITERKRAEDEVNRQQAFLRQVIDSNPNLIFVKDRDSKYLLANYAIANAYGTTPAYMQGKTDLELGVPAEEFAKYRQDDIEVLQSGKEKIIPDEIFSWQSGEVHYYHTTKRPLLDEKGEFKSLLAVSVDITNRKKTEEALARSEERYRNVLEQMQDSYFEVDLTGNFTFVNDATCHHLGYPREELLGKNFRIIMSEEQALSVFEAYNTVYQTGVPKNGFAFQVRRKDGTEGYAETSISLLNSKQGRPIGFRSVGRDITERKQMQLKLEEMSTHDYLTGLPNRVLLLDRFNIAAALAHRNKARLAVMSLDLDNFKSINDTLGHDAGDQVLKAVSKRFTGIIRASDTVARVGGDEFILVMLETKHMEDAATIAQKILDSFAEPLFIDGHQLHLSTSIGMAVYPEDAEDMETLIKKSDAAMYHCKGHGGNQFKFYGDGCPH